MKPCLLIFFFIFFVSLPINYSAFNFPNININANLVKNNETILSISKQLCQGCTAENIEWMFEQNYVRATKGEQPLIWDYRLERYAKWYANVRKADCKLIHSKPVGYDVGENIFWGGGQGWTPKDAVKDWADEVKIYDYSSNTCIGGADCLHYTQIVWRNTRKVGCARVICNNGDVFMTCNYYPPGNWDGERPF